MTLLYFGPLRDLTGTGRETLTLDPCTPAALWRLLVERYPSLQDCRAHVQMAVDQEIVQFDSDRLIEARSEVALLPPMSGG